MALSRIISCTPSTTDILNLLGLRNAIVGADDLSMQMPPNPECIALGPVDNIHVDRAKQLNPDIIIATSTIPGAQATIDHLEADGLTVLTLNSERMDDLISDTFTIGIECDVEDKARDMVEKLNHEMKRICSIVAQTDEPVTAYMERYPYPFVSIGAENWATDMLKRAGALNIFNEVTNPTFTPAEEVIIDQDPDVIFICWAGMGDDISDLDKKEILKRKGWGDMKAIKKKQVYYLPESLFAYPGPKMLEGLELLIELVAQVNAVK